MFKVEINEYGHDSHTLPCFSFLAFQEAFVQHRTALTDGTVTVSESLERQSQTAHLLRLFHCNCPLPCDKWRYYRLAIELSSATTACTPMGTLWFTPGRVMKSEKTHI